MNLSNRIKKYEKTFYYSALSRMPLMIRVDGKAFHTLTKNLNKPFDGRLIDAMVKSAEFVAHEMQGFKVAYIQSDEVSFCLTDYDNLETQGWFDYELPKIISISASLMTVAFNNFFETDKMPVFDSRAFTLPKEEIVNAFLWRAQDWQRNSLQMYCRSLFSHKELYQKKQNDMHEMLYSIRKNWAIDLSDQEKNGTFLIKNETGIFRRTDILPTYENINSAIGKSFIFQ